MKVIVLTNLCRNDIVEDSYIECFRGTASKRKKWEIKRKLCTYILLVFVGKSSKSSILQFNERASR
jgi:hypothetical protein